MKFALGFLVGLLTGMVIVLGSVIAVVAAVVASGEPSPRYRRHSPPPTRPTPTTETPS